MKRVFPILLDILHDIALAVWLGGLVLFLSVAAGPWTLSRSPLDATNVVLGVVWSGLGGWAERCGIVMVAVQFVLRRRFQRSRTRYIGDGVRQLLTFAALLLTEYLHRSPNSHALLQSHTVPGATILAPNSVFMNLCLVQSLLLIAVIALTAWLHRSAAPVDLPATQAPAPVKPATPIRPTAGAARRRGTR